MLGILGMRVLRKGSGEGEALPSRNSWEKESMIYGDNNKKVKRGWGGGGGRVRG